MFDKPDGPGGDPERMKKVCEISDRLYNFEWLFCCKPIFSY